MGTSIWEGWLCPLNPVPHTPGPRTPYPCTPGPHVPAPRAPHPTLYFCRTQSRLLSNQMRCWLDWLWTRVPNRLDQRPGKALREGWRLGQGAHCSGPVLRAQCCSGLGGVLTATQRGAPGLASITNEETEAQGAQGDTPNKRWNRDSDPDRVAPEPWPFSIKLERRTRWVKQPPSAWVMGPCPGIEPHISLPAQRGSPSLPPPPPLPTVGSLSPSNK